MKFGGIENITLREKIYKLLKEKISTAAILPGERLTIRGLAAQINVSLVPVREAIFQLESEKIVEIESNKQIRVKNLTGPEIEEIFRIREILEAMAVERACDLRARSALPKLKRILDQLQSVVGKFNAYLKYNHKFHFEIYELAESPILIEVISNLWARTGPYLYLHFDRRKDLTVNMKYHAAMYEALVERDKKKMARALRKDLKVGSIDIIRAIESE